MTSTRDVLFVCVCVCAQSHRVVDVIHGVSHVLKHTFERHEQVTVLKSLTAAAEQTNTN